MKKISGIVTLILVSGCATSDDQMRMAIAAQQNVKPTLRVICPAGGCEVEYTDPRDKGNIKLPTNGWDTLNTAISASTSILQGVIVPGAMGIVAVKGFEAMKNHGATSTVTTTTNTSSTASTTNTNTTLSGTGTIGGGSFSSTVTNTDSTHAPTVVTQPAPIVVRPEVVTP